MRKNSKNEKVIRAMAIGISAMLMASSPLTALAAEGEGNSSEGNEDKNITVTPEAGVCDQAEAAAKDADKAVEGAEKSAADVKAEVVDKVAAGDVKDAGGKDLSQDILDANAKVEDKTVEDGSSLKDAESAVENADTALGVAEANDKLSDAELNKAADAAANAGQTAAEAMDSLRISWMRLVSQMPMLPTMMYLLPWIRHRQILMQSSGSTIPPRQLMKKPQRNWRIMKRHMRMR